MRSLQQKKSPCKRDLSGCTSSVECMKSDLAKFSYDLPTKDLNIGDFKTSTLGSYSRIGMSKYRHSVSTGESIDRIQELIFEGFQITLRRCLCCRKDSSQALHFIRTPMPSSLVLRVPYEKKGSSSFSGIF